MFAALWVVWMERNKRIFELYSGEEMGLLWQRVRSWASLWCSVLEFLRTIADPLSY